jgi:hypothetical protein
MIGITVSKSLPIFTPEAKSIVNAFRTLEPVPPMAKIYSFLDMISLN